MGLTSKLTINTPVQYDGDRWIVKGFVGGSIQLHSSSGKKALTDLVTLTSDDSFKILESSPESNSTELLNLIDNVPENLIKDAEALLAHLCEMETGYKSGNKATAQPSEPRFEYDLDGTTLNQRVAAKSKEIGISERTLWEQKAAYVKFGLYGLVDRRLFKEGKSKVDARVLQAIRHVLAELTDKSNVTRKRIIQLTKFRAQEQYPGQAIKFPSIQTFYRLLETESKGQGTFGSAKSRRSIANRPKDSYRTQPVSRPGEFVLIDSTPLDAFAIDPVSFKWIQLQVTIGLDLYTRSIVGWRFTPVSTKGVDAALLLYDIIRPKAMQKGWPEQARWSYIGVPESIVIELTGEVPGHGVAGIPVLHPETVVVDHGRVFVSQAFKDACTRLGINLQLARPYTPTDKAQVERVFRTIRENFVEGLPGYKGPDIYSRGLNVEDDAFYFLDEIESRFACWVATIYQTGKHDGLFLPCLPLLDICPNDLYNEGLMRAGFVHVVSNDLMYYDLLPTEWRNIQHYGIDLRTLRYNNNIFSDYRNVTSPYSGLHKGKWPIRYDPRDLSYTFFYDISSEKWHSVPWVHDASGNQPFNEVTLSFAKSLVVAQGGNVKSIDEVAESLNALLARMSIPDQRNRRERRLAAVNAMHAELVLKDRPAISVRAIEPDAEVELFVDGHLQGARTTVLGDTNAAEHSAYLIPLRSLDEAMEDDDDELGF